MVAKGISTDDSPFEQRWGQNVAQMRQLARFFGDHPLTEDDACLGLVEVEMMHFPLILGQMPLCPA